VDYVGVSNLFTFLDNPPPYWMPMMDVLYEMVGHPVDDRELLEAASPLFHADRIQAPLLVAQGANDPRVRKAESDQIVDALRSRGIDVPYLVKENEGHGFVNQENRFEFYREMERFLAKHLGGRVEESGG
jgi:dipeptidyl aminopeptidase/acylaminoacyl peptidase